MSSTLGSAASLSRSAGGLSAGLQQRNRYWIQFLEGRIAEVEGKMRASGELERAREIATGNDATLPAANDASIGTAAGVPAATPGGGAWSWPGFTNGAGYSGEEAE